jgi:hypothetical protein
MPNLAENLQFLIVGLNSTDIGWLGTRMRIAGVSYD